MIRFLRASWLFAFILASYGWLWLRVRVRGRERSEAAIERCHERNAARLYRGFRRLRGVYIKVGQVLSVLGSFLPAAYVRQLEGLQDQVPPRSIEVVRRTFLAQLGAPPEALYASFAERPIAAASLGQVHKALANDGEPLAVKVLYPDIQRIIRIDMRVLRWVFRVWTRIVPVNQLSTVLDQLEDVLERETNYLNEAQNMALVRANFVGEAGIVLPTVRKELTTQAILTMSFMDGVKISDVAALDAAGINRTEVARILVQSYYKQLLIDGLFHADPHPGNFLVRPGPEIVFLDFGAVEPVRDTLRRGMIIMLEGIIGQDDDKALEGIETMGFVAPDGNRELLDRTVRHYFSKLVTLQVADYSKLDVEQIVSKEELRAIRGRMRELMRSVRYPEGYFYIERTLLLLFGLSALLDPKVNALELGFPYAMRFILEEKQRQYA